MLKIQSGVAAFKTQVQGFETAVMAEIPAITEGARAAAVLLAAEGLTRSVYGTVPGRRYVRTGTLARSVTVRVLSRGANVTLELLARAPYASLVEYGSGPSPLNEVQLRTLAEALPGSPLVFGRSGQKYLLPGPFLLPAAVGALERAKKLFEQSLVKHWR